MSLEFNQIVEQVYKMGSMLEKLDFDLTGSLEIARTRFAESSDLGRVREYIEWVQSSDISRYRGAAPLNLPNAEPINAIVPEPQSPEHALVIAVDGSQIYPDEMAPVHYYLTNIGLFVYHHGQDITPQQYTFPELFFHKDHVHDRYGRVIRNRVVDDRRTLTEMKTLAAATWDRRKAGVPVVALYDNRLMFLPGGDNGKSSEDLLGAYLGAMVHLHDSGAILAGYVDNPVRSKRFIQLLWLMSFTDRDELKSRQASLTTGGDLESLRDHQFFHNVLKKGERSAVMVQSSPQNKEFKDRGENYEIAFFYLKVYNKYQTRIVRVDIPVWVARDKQKIELLHALILQQCKMQGRNPYPYAITRADELAWVGGKDRAKLEEMVNAQVRRVKQELVGDTLSAKASTKLVARSEKRYHQMRGEIDIDER